MVVAGTAEMVRSGRLFDEVQAGVRAKYGLMATVSRALGGLALRRRASPTPTPCAGPPRDPAQPARGRDRGRPGAGSAQANSDCPTCSPGPVPGGIAKSAEPVTLRYSIIASLVAIRFCPPAGG